MTATIGIDIGQKRDPTAICVAQAEFREGDAGAHFLIRHLERLPLGTPYPQVARRIGEVAKGAKQQKAYPDLYVDVTGVGKPVADLVEEAAIGLDVFSVYFTHGDRRVEDEERQVK